MQRKQKQKQKESKQNRKQTSGWPGQRTVREEVGPVMYWGLEAEASAGKTVQEVCQESKNWDEAIQEEK